MHICFLTGEYPHPDYPHGGVGTFVQTLGRALVQRGIEVSVVGIGYADQDVVEEDRGVQITRLRRSNWLKFSAFDNSKRINAALQELHINKPIDVIESAELGFAFIRKIPGIRYLIRMHGGHHYFAVAENRGTHPWKGLQEKRSFKKADSIIGVSQYVVNHTLEYIDFKDKFRGVIFNPANLERFYEADPSKAIPGRIFFAGTVCEKKGIRQLVQALPEIKRAVPEAHLVVAGRDWHFPKTGKSYIAYLQKYIDTSVRDSIFFLGPIPNQQIPVEIEKSSVCCYPSHMEAMPLAWIEVMSMGKPFVASDLGPGPEIVRNYKTGLRCNPLDPEDIAEKIIYMFKHPDEAAAMGKAARQFALENFAINRIVEQNIALYNSLLCAS